MPPKRVVPHTKPDSTSTFVSGIDLFSGAGGLTLGFKEAGIKTVRAVEIDPYRVETFAKHTPDAEIIDADITRVNLRKYRNTVDVLYGGPPCQPFSSGGLRNGQADSRDMMPHFIDAVRTIRPEAFFMENVPGLTAGDRRAYFVAILNELRVLGYHVTWKVLNAADYGVPQNRRRLFVVGMRERMFRFPKETHGPGRTRAYLTVNDVLPPYQVGEPNPSLVFYAKNPDLRPSPFDGHLFNGGGRPIDKSQPSDTILASAGGNKTHFFDDLGIVPEYHRHLLAGGAPGEGVVPGARRLTVLESATLQTFPSSVVFCGPRSVQYHQVGDAVPPKLAAVLGRALVRQLLAQSDNDLEEDLHEPALPLLSVK